MRKTQDGSDIETRHWIGETKRKRQKETDRGKDAELGRDGG